MRWQELFSDLEGQLLAAEAAELAGEVAERSRREAGLVRLVDRLAASVGHEVGVHLHGAGQVRGRLVDTGPDWLLLDDAGAEVLVPLGAVLGVSGAGRMTADPEAGGVVGARLDLRWALRGLARSRAGVLLGLLDGTRLAGTLDRVGADHLDLAEHGRGEARRAGTVRQVRLVPLAAVSFVRSG